jgi:hypothetical protein
MLPPEQYSDREVARIHLRDVQPMHVPGLLMFSTPNQDGTSKCLLQSAYL